MIDPRKEYFDAARAADADGVLVLDDLNKIHAVLDLAGIPRAVATKVVVSHGDIKRTIGEKGLDLIKHFEGCKLKAYPDPASPLAKTGKGSGAPWTIGWGHTGPEVTPGLVWTREEADAQLAFDLVRYAKEVSTAIGDAPTNQAQFDAMVSFHYNTGKIADSTLLKKHKAGDFVGAAAEFGRWKYAQGAVSPGLVRRRASEAALYRGQA